MIITKSDTFKNFYSSSSRRIMLKHCFFLFMLRMACMSASRALPPTFKSSCLTSVEDSGDNRWATGRDAWCSNG